jgi:hypothetical protein
MSHHETPRSPNYPDCSNFQTPSQRVYTYGELSRLLGDAGFGDIEGLGSLAEEPFRLGSPRLYLSATKIP